MHVLGISVKICSALAKVLNGVSALDELDDEAGGQLQEAPECFAEAVFDPALQRQPISLRDPFEPNSEPCHSPVNGRPTMVEYLLQRSLID